MSAAMDDMHEGTLEQASTRYYYVQCSCGWRSFRYLNVIENCWSHHEGHVRNKEWEREIQERIHGKKR